MPDQQPITRAQGALMAIIAVAVIANGIFLYQKFSLADCHARLESQSVIQANIDAMKSQNERTKARLDGLGK